MKVWPIDPLVPGNFRLEVPEKLPQGWAVRALPGGFAVPTRRGGFRGQALFLTEKAQEPEHPGPACKPTTRPWPRRAGAVKFSLYLIALV